MLRQSWCCDPKEKHVVWNRQRIRLKNRHSTILLLCACVCVYVCVYAEVMATVTGPPRSDKSLSPTTHTHTHICTDGVFPRHWCCRALINS